MSTRRIGSWIWLIFFERSRRALYDFFVQAKAAVQKLKIYTMSQYKKGGNQDLKLPASPDKYYGEEWTGWADYLPANPDPKFYATMAEAAEVVKRLGITTKAEYNVRYREDPACSKPKCYQRRANGLGSRIFSIV